MNGRPGGDAATLEKIKHIVVLMMENRSFDHMLGYLKTDGMPEVNGLTGDESNEDDRGQPITVFPFPAGETAFHLPDKPFDESLDPQHGPSSVAEQLADGNGGFVKNFIREKKPPEQWRSLPMGHYTGKHLPVYDFLARQYCVCDAWHSSIPGDTWPNRLYALAATHSAPVGHKLRPLERLFRYLGGAGTLRKIEKQEREPLAAAPASWHAAGNNLADTTPPPPAEMPPADHPERPPATLPQPHPRKT